jgi:hypothetical protein
MKEKIKEFFLEIGALIIVAIVIGGIYYVDHLSNGPLTTTRTCTGSYIHGEMSAKAVKKECPNLKKEEIINSIEKAFNSESTNFDKEHKDYLISEIENIY